MQITRMLFFCSLTSCLSATMVPYASYDIMKEAIPRGLAPRLLWINTAKRSLVIVIPYSKTWSRCVENYTCLTWLVAVAQMTWLKPEAFMQEKRIFLMQTNPVVIFSLSRELNFNGRQGSRAMVMFGSNPIWNGGGLPFRARVTFMWEFCTIPLANCPIWGVLAPASTAVCRWEGVFPTQLSLVLLWVWITNFKLYSLIFRVKCIC